MSASPALSSPSGSAAGQGIDLRAAGRRRLRRPGLAGIEAGPHLAAVGGAGHAARLAFIEGDLEHRVRHWAADIDLRPAVAAIAAAQQYAEVADKTRAGRAPQMPRVARHLADVAAVYLPLHVERLQRHMRPVVAAVGAAPHHGAGDAEHGPPPPAAPPTGARVGSGSASSL